VHCKKKMLKFLADAFGYCARCASSLDDGTLKKLTIGPFIAQTLIVQAANGKMLGGRSNQEVSKMFSTLVTPSGWAFAIWGAIYSWEMISCIQIYSSARLDDDAKAGLPWFALANVFQLCWALVFSREYMGASALLLGGITSSLLVALESFRNLKGADYYTIFLPISLHAGWVTVATLLNVNLLAVKAGASTAVQLTAAFGTLYAGLGAAFLFAAFRQNALYALSIAWACFGIFCELPASKACPDLDAAARLALKYTAGGCAGVAGQLALATLLFQLLAD